MFKCFEHDSIKTLHAEPYVSIAFDGCGLKIF